MLLQRIIFAEQHDVQYRTSYRRGDRAMRLHLVVALVPRIDLRPRINFDDTYSYRLQCSGLVPSRYARPRDRALPIDPGSPSRRVVRIPRTGTSGILGSRTIPVLYDSLRYIHQEPVKNLRIYGNFIREPYFTLGPGPCVLSI